MLSSGVRASATEHDDLRTLQGDNLVTSSQNPARSTLWPPDGRLHVLGEENTTSDPERRHRQRGRATLGSAVSVSYSGDLTAFYKHFTHKRVAEGHASLACQAVCTRVGSRGVHRHTASTRGARSRAAAPVSDPQKSQSRNVPKKVCSAAK